MTLGFGAFVGLALSATSSAAECLSLNVPVEICETRFAEIDPLYLQNPGLAATGSAGLFLKTDPRVSVFVKVHNRAAADAITDATQQMAVESHVTRTAIEHKGLKGVTLEYRTSSANHATTLLDLGDQILIVAVERPEEQTALPEIGELSTMSLASVFPEAAQ